MKPRLLTSAVSSVAALTVAIVATTSLASSVVAQPVAPEDLPDKEGRVGQATVVVGGSDDPVVRGGSATEFSLELAEGAACPGDSASGDWRVQSFLVPAADDPGTFSYESTKPAGAGRWALYPLDTRSYIDKLTAVAAEEGGEGVIDERPIFTFVLFPPNTLPDGTYRLGIACSLRGETYRYWDNQIIITNTPEDQPAQLTWELVDSSSVSSGSSSSFPVLVIAGLGIAVAAVIVAFVIRRGRRSRPLVNS
jgi:hypothetical protein